MAQLLIGVVFSLTTMAVPVGRPEPWDDAPVAAKLAEVKAQNEMLWKRLAVVTVQKILEEPTRKEIAAAVGNRLDSPSEYMEVVDSNETARAMDHLRDFAELQKTTFPKADPKGVVVVYLNGPAGGAWRIGVVFGRADGTTRAVVFVPGK